MSDEIKETLKLRKPITGHGDKGAAVTMTELKFKEPPGRLVLHKGLPFSILIEESKRGGNRIEFRIIPDLAIEYLVAMTGLDELLLEQLSAVDVRQAHQIITKMLNPTEA
jgi:hypothetical protein